MLTIDGNYKEIQLEGFESDTGWKEEELLKVSSTSRAKDFAKTIDYSFRHGRRHTIRGIGAGAVNEGIKACTILKEWKERGPDPVYVLFDLNFSTVDGDDGNITAISITPMYFKKEN